MTQVTLPGVEGVQKRELSQWYTPRPLAERVVEWALDPFVVPGPIHVLEPSAGRGALVKPLIARGCLVTAIDIDPDNVSVLAALDCVSQHGDFLLMPLNTANTRFEKYPLCIMNPPFENGQAEAHVLHALSWAERVVAHVPLTMLEGQSRRELFWSHLRLHRLAVCASRAKYGAEGGATAMCTIDVTTNGPAVGVCEWRDVTVEVWP